MQTYVMKIEGMMCQGCVAGCTMALEDIAGVSKVEVSLEEREARVEYDASQVGVETLEEAVKELGITVVK